MLDSIPPASPAPKVQFVFLHGSGLGPWIWDSARERLAVPSVALEVPSRQVGTSPARCALDLLSHPEFPRGSSIVLVLHSLAGVLESELAAALGERLLKVIHVAAVVPAPGQSFASTRGFPTSLILRLLFRFHPHGLAPSPSMILDQLGGGLDPAQRTSLVARFRPEYPGLFLEPVADRSMDLRRTYLRCTRDRSVPLALQTRIARRLGAEIVDLEAGHLPMMSDPESFAGILARVVFGHEVPSRVVGPLPESTVLPNGSVIPCPKP